MASMSNYPTVDADHNMLGFILKLDSTSIFSFNSPSVDDGGFFI